MWTIIVLGVSVKVFLGEDGIKINLLMWVGPVQALEASADQRVGFSKQGGGGVLSADDLWT